MDAVHTTDNLVRMCTTWEPLRNPPKEDGPMPEANRRHETVSFTIDGRPFTIDDRHETAAALLTLAGLDPGSDDDRNEK